MVRTDTPRPALLSSWCSRDKQRCNVRAEGKGVIIVEGILIFAHAELRDLLDVKIFVDTVRWPTISRNNETVVVLHSLTVLAMGGGGTWGNGQSCAERCCLLGRHVDTQKPPGWPVSSASLVLRCVVTGCTQTEYCTRCSVSMKYPHINVVPRACPAYSVCFTYLCFF